MLASELPAWLVRVGAFVFGATWGSFFNVAIHRWPREMSVVSPPSHCPACGAPVPARRNVPIVSYLVQRGRAACCGARMTPRYLIVELAAAALALALAERFVVRAAPDAELGPVLLESALWFAFVGGLLVATFVDLEWMEIPDEVTIGGTALALATAGHRSGVPLEEIALGAGGGYLAVEILLVWSWERLTKERGMGEGDAKLAMLIGAFLGWRGALFALVAGSFQGIVAYAATRAAGVPIGPPRAPPGEPAAADAGAGHDGERPPSPEPAEGPAREPDEGEDAERSRRWIPFGPFLALGAIEFLFFGERIVDLYLSLFD